MAISHQPPTINHQPSTISDMEAACRRFASLPTRIELAARWEEVEMMKQSAEARGGKVLPPRDLVAEAQKALAAGEVERARSLTAEAQKEALSLHETADREQKPVAAVNPKSPAEVLLPPQVAPQDRYEANYLISFAEEKAREAVKQRAEALVRAALGRPGEARLCEEVRQAEQALLQHYFGLPIHWTREHIPGQPDFFWRPFAVKTARSDWEEALLKYLHPNDQLWLAVRRIEAAERLVSE